jgi:hypothetical protein
MYNDQGHGSLFEHLAVVAILLLVAAIAIQNVWHEVKGSEEPVMNNAAGEYEALKKMYPEQLQSLPLSKIRMNTFGAIMPDNAPMN